MQSIAQPIALDLTEGKKSISFPFELRQGLIIVSTLLEGALPINLIFDTGAENTIIFHEEYADLLGLEFDNKVRVLGSDLDAMLYANVVRRAEIAIDNVIHVRRDILVLEEDVYLFREKLGFNVDGILGGSFFKGMIVDINYKKKRITVYNPLSYKQPKGYSQHSVIIRDNKPYISANVSVSGDHLTASSLLLDTGAALPILLHSNTDSLLIMPESVLAGSIGYGLGGALSGFTGRIDRLELGKYRYKELLTSFQNIDSAGLTLRGKYIRNGIIGNEMLSRFRVVINYMLQEVYLRPRKGYDRRFEYDKSGLTIFAFGEDLNRFIIKKVLDDSPADEAGLMPGDIIKKIQWRKDKFWSLEGIIKLLKKKSGKKIKMTVDRNGELIKVRFRLQPLIK